MNRLISFLTIISIIICIIIVYSCGGYLSTSGYKPKEEDSSSGDNTLPSRLSFIAGSGSVNCALFENGKVKCWGRNIYGELGQGNTISIGENPHELQNLPYIDLGANLTVDKIFSGGWGATCALFSNNRIKCWGRGHFGRLGYGDQEHRGDEPNEMGDNLDYVDLGTNRTLKDLSIGERHLCAILDNNGVKCWGQNEYGQLGLGDTLDRGDEPNEMGDNLDYVDLGIGRTALKIELGQYHSCVLLDNHEVKCWGRGHYGRLGKGNESHIGNVPGQMGDALAAIDFGENLEVMELKAGWHHNCVILDNGNVKCWGRNFFGQLGLGDTNNRGDNVGEMGDFLPAVDLNGKTPVSLSLGESHSCALFHEGVLRCWGRGLDGELGNEDVVNIGDEAFEMGHYLSEVHLGEGLLVLQIISPSTYNCAILSDQSEKCWGANTWGRLGLGDIENRGDDPFEMGDLLEKIIFF